jgi:hypothetical protein
MKSRTALRLSHGLLLLACSGALLAPTAARADWLLDAAAGYTYDDNLPNALNDSDRKADSALSASVRAGISEQLATNTGLTLALLAEQNLYLRYSGLTNFGAGAQARLRHKFGLGADTPWAALSAQALHRNYHYDYRDGWQYDAGLTAGKRLSERLSVQGSVHYDRYTADRLQPTILPGFPTDAYDVWGWTFGARAAYAITESDLLSAAYAWRNGTVTAITPRDPEILEYSSALARDPVFGTEPPLVAYRIAGKTDIVSLAWSHAFSPRISMTMSYLYRRTVAPEDLGGYYSNVVSIFLGYSR